VKQIHLAEGRFARALHSKRIEKRQWHIPARLRSIYARPARPRLQPKKQLEHVSLERKTRYLKIVHLYYHKSASMKDCSICREIPILTSVDTRPTEHGCSSVGCTDPRGVREVHISIPGTNITKYLHHPGVVFDRGFAHHKSRLAAPDTRRLRQHLLARWPLLATTQRESVDETTALASTILAGTLRFVLIFAIRPRTRGSSYHTRPIFEHLVDERQIDRWSNATLDGCGPATNRVGES
jgi:hypothetical protein